MRGNSGDENYDADIGYVFVKVTPELAKLILKRVVTFRRLKKEDKEALETYYWDRNALYLRHEKVEEEDAKEINTDLLIETKRSFDLDTSENMECCQMRVDEDTVGFTAIPKHTSIYITSERIPLNVIREVLKKKKGKKK
jgi:hypothetical protein